MIKFHFRKQLPFVMLVLLAGSAGADTLASGMLNGQAPSACRAGMRVYESDRGTQLLGEVIQADFPRLLSGWDEEYASYEPRAEDVATLAGIQDDTSIICVLGTWCHDSQREVPRFWKILEEAANPHLELTMFAAGRSSDQKALDILDNIGFDESLRETYGVTLVPTFIFMSGETELGRIIETPEATLEQDAAQILSPENAGEPAWR